jgi:hypothetical protein
MLRNRMNIYFLSKIIILTAKWLKQLRLHQNQVFCMNKFCIRLLINNKILTLNQIFYRFHNVP